MNKNTVKIKCTKCGSKKFDCYDTTFDDRNGICFAYCVCEKCDTQFKVKYEIVSVEED